MVDPPFDAGATQVMTADVEDASAVTPVGAPGMVRGVTDADGVELADGPAALVAMAVKV